MGQNFIERLGLGSSSQLFAKWGARLILLVLLGIATLLLIGFVRMTWTEHQIDRARAEQQATNEALRAQVEQLKAEAEYHESDAYVEQAAREQLGMAREGEVVLLPTVALPPVELASTNTPDSLVVAAGPVPNYQRWWNVLFQPHVDP
jgi:cell division protein FtsB